MAFGPRARRIVFASLLALVLVAVTAFLARNAIATAAARTVASRLLGVNVEIDAVKLDLLGLGVETRGLVPGGEAVAWHRELAGRPLDDRHEDRERAVAHRIVVSDPVVATGRIAGRLQRGPQRLPERRGVRGIRVRPCRRARGLRLGESSCVLSPDMERAVGPVGVEDNHP
jgi:hypothetical protein